jgi:hypothetical protein
MILASVAVTEINIHSKGVLNQSARRSIAVFILIVSSESAPKRVHRGKKSDVDTGCGRVEVIWECELWQCMLVAGADIREETHSPV